MKYVVVHIYDSELEKFPTAEKTKNHEEMVKEIKGLGFIEDRIAIEEKRLITVFENETQKRQLLSDAREIVRKHYPDWDADFAVEVR